MRTRAAFVASLALALCACSGSPGPEPAYDAESDSAHDDAAITEDTAIDGAMSHTGDATPTPNEAAVDSGSDDATPSDSGEPLCCSSLSTGAYPCTANMIDFCVSDTDAAPKVTCKGGLKSSCHISGTCAGTVVPCP